MKRWIALSVTLAFLAGCTGAGGGSGFVPGGSPVGNVPAADGADGSHQVHVALTMRIPRHHRRERAAMHPATISPATKSISISINNGTPRIFNATPSSAGCGISGGKTVCTFSVAAPAGSDSFAVKTYSAINGTGSVLNYGVAVVVIVAGKANTAHVSLGPVVTNTADTGLGSLRYAVGSANAGDTIMFLLHSPSTITLSSPITLNTGVNISGPGFTASARRRTDAMHPDVTFSGISISGGGTQQLFVINAGVSATISGLILTNGKATASDTPGGAIYNAGAVALSKDAFVSNKSAVNSPYARRAPHSQLRRAGRKGRSLHPHVCPAGTDEYGGALYNHGLMTVTGSTFSGNSVSNEVFDCYYGYGGAIYNDYYGTLVSSGNTYSANSAYEGGAVYNNSYYGQATFTGDVFSGNLGCTSANGCPAAGCGTTGCTTSYPLGYGAAIADNEGPGITITNSTFTNNVAGGSASDSFGEGGALYLDSGSPSTITGSKFTGNVAGGGTNNCSYGYGGAIATYYALDLENDTFTNNFAGGDYEGEGGAVYADASGYQVTGSNDTFTTNTAKGTGGPCNASAIAYGGGVYANYGSTFSSTKFTGNVATSNYESEGGGLYSDDPSTLTSDTFSSNKATGTGANGATQVYAEGGGLYVCGSSRLSGSTFTSNSASVTSANASEADGGGAYSCDTLASLNNTFTSNSVSETVGTSGYAEGGGMYYDSNTSSSGDKFTSNTASSHYYAYAGGLYADGAGSISNDTFTSNIATTNASYAFGGGLAIESNPIGVSNSTFTGNKSTTTGGASTYGYGGGIYDDGGNTTISSVKITGNTTTTYGGGIENDSVEALYNSTISGNFVTATQAGGGGGGIYADASGSGTTITNSVISGNSVAVTGTYSGGGGIYNNEGIVMTGTTVSGNKVTGTGASSGGGGIFDYFDATLTNDTITGNSSSKDGGGIEIYDTFNNYTTLVNNVTLYQNSATGLGGNIYNPFATNFVLANTIVAGGSASSGKDINNSGAGNTASADYNLIQTAVVGNALGGTTTHDVNGLDPKLLALAANGGPTPTNAEQATSPSVAKIPWSAAGGGTCGTIHPVPTDQRGFTRGAASGGTRCDIGAFELAGVASSIVKHVYAPVLRPNGHRHHRGPNAKPPKGRDRHHSH